jgi:hypothetical protein
MFEIRIWQNVERHGACSRPKADKPRAKSAVQGIVICRTPLDNRRVQKFQGS